MPKQRKKKRTPARPNRPPGAASGSPVRQATPKPSRQERIEAAHRHRRRRRLVRGGIAVGAGVVLLGVIAGVVVADRRASARTVRQLEAGACEYDRQADGDQGQGRNHVTGSPAYRVNPPAGGNHLVAAAAPGVYTDTVPPDGQLVHAMEHGDIVLWHRPDVAPDVLNQLRDVANRYDRDVLVVPRGSLSTPVAATAWHRRLLCPGFEREPVELFVKSFRDKGPEKLDED